MMQQILLGYGRSSGGSGGGIDYSGMISSNLAWDSGLDPSTGNAFDGDITTRIRTVLTNDGHIDFIPTTGIPFTNGVHIYCYAANGYSITNTYYVDLNDTGIPSSGTNFTGGGSNYNGPAWIQVATGSGTLYGLRLRLRRSGSQSHPSLYGISFNGADNLYLLTDVDAPVTYTGHPLNNVNGNGCADGGTRALDYNTGRSQPNTAGTATFSSGIAYSTLQVIFGDAANGQLGSVSGAQLSINGSVVTAQAMSNGDGGYSTSYHMIYSASNGTLNSIGISAGVGGSHQAYIFAIIIDGKMLNATGPTWS